VGGAAGWGSTGENPTFPSRYRSSGRRDIIPASQLDTTNYPGLNAQSIALWQQWLKLYEPRFTSYEYNVRVGQGILAPAYLTQAEKDLWKKLTQKRIDVVAERPGQTWIIEIMERPGLAAVGQLIGYQHLYAKYVKTPEKFVAALICARLGYDMRLIFDKQNVVIFQFKVGKGPVLPSAFLPAVAGIPFSTYPESQTP